VERDGGEFVYDNVRFRLADGDRVARLRVRMLVPDGKADRLFLAAIEEVQEPGSPSGSVEDFQADQVLDLMTTAKIHTMAAVVAAPAAQD
jgi:hypothetical protein